MDYDLMATVGIAVIFVAAIGWELWKMWRDR